MEVQGSAGTGHGMDGFIMAVQGSAGAGHRMDAFLKAFNSEPYFQKDLTLFLLIFKELQSCKA